MLIATAEWSNQLDGWLATTCIPPLSLVVSCVFFLSFLTINLRSTLVSKPPTTLLVNHNLSMQAIGAGLMAAMSISIGTWLTNGQS